MFTPLSLRRRRDQMRFYVDQLELDDLSLSDYRNGLMIDPNLTIYFADVNGGLAESLRRVPRPMVWVRDLPARTARDGAASRRQFLPMNRSLALSTDLDSDQDGTANAYDSIRSITLPIPRSAFPARRSSALALTLSAQSAASSAP